MSLLTDIRDQIIYNIETIALDPTPSGLGLDDTGSIHPYLHEFEKDEKKSGYLAANVNSSKEVRAYGVQVTNAVNELAIGSVTNYTYNIHIELYYPTGETGVNNLINAYDAIVKEILKGALPCLLDIIESISDLNISKVPGEGKEGEILQGIFTIEGTVNVTVT